MQTFTPAAPLAAADTAPRGGVSTDAATGGAALVRAGSQHCLRGSDAAVSAGGFSRGSHGGYGSGDAGVVGGFGKRGFGARGRASSHQVLSALDPELVSPVCAALHGRAPPSDDSA